MASPLVTYGLVTGGGALCSWIGLPWTLWALLLVTLVFSAATFAVQRYVPHFLAPDAPEDGAEAGVVSRNASIAVAACAAVGGIFGAWVLRRGMGSLDAVVQDWDGIFHGAVVRWIVEAQDLSQASLALLNNRETAETFYYPNAWHGLAALGFDLNGGSVPGLLNTGSMLVPIFLTFGIAALVLRMTRNPVAAGAAALLAPVPTALVYDLLWRGPVIPFAVGLVLVPALVVLFDRTLASRAPGALLVAGIAAGGVVGVHPSGVYTAMIFLGPWMIQRWITNRKRVVPDLLALCVVGAVALVTASASLLAAMAAGTSSRQNWPAEVGPWKALSEGLLLDHARSGPQWAIAILAMVSLVGIWKIRGLWWFWVSGAISLLLFIVSSAYDHPVTEDLTAPWWNDRWRFAAMVAIFLVVAAGIGCALIIDWVGRLLERITPLGRPATAVIATVALGIGLVVATERGDYAENSYRVAWAFQSGDLVDEDDFALWERAADIVPEGQLVMNDPINGTTWMYALEGLQPYFGGMAMAIPDQPGPAPQQNLFLMHFDEIATNEAVQAAVEAEGIEYVIVGDGRLHGMYGAPGFDNLDDNPAFELIDQVGGAKLFRIVTP